MKKRIISLILFTLIGLVIAVFAETFFRNLIQDLFLWKGNGNIQLVGKDFHLFNNPIYYVSFSLTTLLFGIAFKNEPIRKILINGILHMVTFGFILFGISILNAESKIVQCTICENGILRLHNNNIDYGLILGLSAILSSIGPIIAIKRKFKNKAYNKELL